MLIIPFTSTEADLQNAGGKRLNLARLAQAGFPVPPGFIISTDAYRAYVETNQLQETIIEALKDLPYDAATHGENASTQIRKSFAMESMIPDPEAVIRAAYTALSSSPVVVRSSATTEDLPDLSFAGQQDT